jgi:hypothetical protein
MNAGRRVMAAVAAISFAVVTLDATPTGAAAHADGDAALSEADATLSTPIQLVRWTGQFHETGPSVPVPLPCLEDLCDDFRLAVDLPLGIWSRAGGVQVGVRASHGAVHLYVYDEDGHLVAKSASETAGNAFGDVVLGHDNSVILPEAAHGLYRVVVVSPSPLHADQNLEPVTYAGIAEVEFFPTVQPVRDLLPNLVPLPTSTVRIPKGTGSGLVLIGDEEEGFQAGGCLLEEMVEEGARKCLRFDSPFANIGEGPYEAEVRHQPDGSSQVWQRVFHSDGGYHERFVDDAELHKTHGHFHVTNLAVNRLWLSNAGGDKLGSEPASTGKKTGFCHGDTDNVWFGRKGDAARTYLDGSSCFGLSAFPPTSPQGPFGISVGWADTYSYEIAGQYIEISGVPDGYYLLESEINPLHTVAESDSTDNSIFVLIRICGDEAELVGKENTCSFAALPG